jgi:serine/threonine protein kinase
MVETYSSKNGGRIRVGNELGRGGEATVYEVDDSTVAKIYHKPQNGPKEDKLGAMVQNPPPTEDSNNNLVLVWPQELLYDNAGRLAGFTMPRAEDGQKEIVNYWNRASFKKMVGLSKEEFGKKQGEIDDLLATIGRNFVRIVSSLHHRRYILGDINESNIRVGLTGRIAILDPDSFQIYDHIRRVIYRCPVGKPEFTDPDLMKLIQADLCNASRCPNGSAGHRMSYACVDRTVGHDNFAIAIVLFKLLMVGRHPFDIRHHEGQYPEKIIEGQFPYKPPFDKCPTGTVPRWKDLNSAWQIYFTNTFTTDRRYSTVEVLALFEDSPPFSKPNLGEQKEVDGGFSFAKRPSTARNSTRQTSMVPNNSIGNRRGGPTTVSSQPNAQAGQTRHLSTPQPTNRFATAAKRLNNATRCPNCHKPDPGQFRCSNCGVDLPQPTNRFATAAKRLNNATRCPNCHKPDPGQFRCSNCGVDLPQPTNRFATAAKRLNNATRCPNCHKPDPGQFRCSNCGVDLPPFKTCIRPNCGNHMNVGVRFCSKCGAAN